ncbi:MAG: hypothetical protein NT123_19550 [Proteobacteria bacterium]|nr:hypothetical protein [Pseudomonadota bacterium]
MRLFLALIASALLAGCASYSGSGLRPGEARLGDVQALMGAPAMRWQEPDGSILLAYPRGPLGYHTFMVKLGPDKRLQSITNALEPATFARIQPGMTKGEVLHVLGPSILLPVYFQARDELAWDWRFCSDFGAPSRFSVLFDNTLGTVRSTLSLAEHSPIGMDKAASARSCSR